MEPSEIDALAIEARDAAGAQEIKDRPGSAGFGMQLGHAMARRPWHVTNLAKKINAQPDDVRSWLRGDTLPKPQFVIRMFAVLFESGSIEWSAFTTAYNNAKRA